MRRIEKQTIGSGDWLTLARIYYEGHDGVTRTWETVNRKNSRGAVGKKGATLKARQNRNTPEVIAYADKASVSITSVNI